MQENFFVTVKTEGGKSLVDSKIGGGYFALSAILFRLSHQCLHHGEELERLEMLRGGGTPPSASDSASPTSDSK